MSYSTSFLIFSYLLESLSTTGEVIWGKGKKKPSLEGETLQIHPVHRFLRD